MQPKEALYPPPPPFEFVSPFHQYQFCQGYANEISISQSLMQIKRIKVSVLILADVLFTCIPLIHNPKCTLGTKMLEHIFAVVLG